MADKISIFELFGGETLPSKEDFISAFESRKGRDIRLRIMSGSGRELVELPDRISKAVYKLVKEKDYEPIEALSRGTLAYVGELVNQGEPIPTDEVAKALNSMKSRVKSKSVRKMLIEGDIKGAIGKLFGGSRAKKITKEIKKTGSKGSTLRFLFKEGMILLAAQLLNDAFDEQISAGISKIKGLAGFEDEKEQAESTPQRRLTPEERKEAALVGGLGAAASPQFIDALMGREQNAIQALNAQRQSALLSQIPLQEVLRARRERGMSTGEIPLPAEEIMSKLDSGLIGAANAGAALQGISNAFQPQGPGVSERFSLLRRIFAGGGL